MSVPSFELKWHLVRHDELVHNRAQNCRSTKKPSTSVSVCATWLCKSQIGRQPRARWKPRIQMPDCSLHRVGCSIDYGERAVVRLLVCPLHMHTHAGCKN